MDERENGVSAKGCGRIREAISDTDIEVKAKLLTGRGFWYTCGCDGLNIKEAKLSDGPHGMRTQSGRGNHLGMGRSLPATCYPTASAVACSFNLPLVEKLGAHLGKEAASFGVSMVLGPGLNIKRSPLCGRNFEYFSEDGYLSGKVAAAFVKGVQSTGVTACVKHFALNSREYARMYYDSRADEQTLRETYLTGFEIAVKEGGAGAVMTAYNKVNGEYCNSNAYLISHVLRGEWGFGGLVVSDWGGSSGAAEAVAAGADLEMPECAFSYREIVQEVKNGELKESAVDDSVGRLYDFCKRSEDIKREKFDKKAHSDFCAKVAEECLVLLKNEGGVLPLKAEERVAVIGDFAVNPRYQGAGSSKVNPTSLADIWGAICKTSLNLVGFERGFKRFGGKSARLLKRAVKLAKRADKVVLCLGLDEKSECESCDRQTLKINENQTGLLSALAKLGKKIVVVLSCGSAVTTDWDKDADALLLAHLNGQSGAEAVVRALTGEVNPSGKLAESYPHALSDAPCAAVYAESPLKSDYAEGIFVGYKYYEATGVPVKYPFGFGLSYTRFEYSDVVIDGRGVRFTVKNAGAVAGATVPQVYIRAPRRNLSVSPLELKLFTKVFLSAGESARVELAYDKYSFRVWNAEKHAFEAGGEYEVSLRTDCLNTVFCGRVVIGRDNLPDGSILAEEDGGERGKMTYQEYFDSHISPDERYEEPRKGMVATYRTRVLDLRYCKGVVAKIIALSARICGRSKDKVKAASMEWLSVRTLMQYAGFNAAQAQGFMLACNGHFFKGIKKILFKK